MSGQLRFTNNGQYCVYDVEYDLEFCSNPSGAVSRTLPKGNWLDLCFVKNGTAVREKITSMHALRPGQVHPEFPNHYLLLKVAQHGNSANAQAPLPDVLLSPAQLRQVATPNQTNPVFKMQTSHLFRQVLLRTDCLLFLFVTHFSIVLL